MKSKFTEEILQRIENCGVIAVLTIDDEADAIPLANALLTGGIDVMELTLRTPVALQALKAIHANIPEMLAGVGTVLKLEQVHQAVENGAAFGVAPGLNRRVVEEADRAGLPFAPGIATPSDIELALELGCREMKFFPAEVCGGVTYLNSMASPYAYLEPRFIPLGGISESTMSVYLTSPYVFALGGSWIAPRNLIQSKDWSSITDNAAGARALFEKDRR